VPETAAAKPPLPLPLRIPEPEVAGAKSVPATAPLKDPELAFSKPDKVEPMCVSDDNVVAEGTT
jgi:hypothetical protein